MYIPRFQKLQRERQAGETTNLIRLINKQKTGVQQNWIKALQHHRQTLERKRPLAVMIINNGASREPGSID